MNPLKPTPKDEVEGMTVPPEPPYVTAGPPFPQYPSDEGRYGISILDWFAAHVIEGLAMRADSTIDNLKENGAKDAYWIAAQMVALRSELVIDPTPVPTEPLVPEPEVVITAADAVYKFGNKPPSTLPMEYAPQPLPKKAQAAP